MESWKATRKYSDTIYPTNWKSARILGGENILDRIIWLFPQHLWGNCPVLGSAKVFRFHIFVIFWDSFGSSLRTKCLSSQEPPWRDSPYQYDGHQYICFEWRSKKGMTGELGLLSLCLTKLMRSNSLDCHKREDKFGRKEEGRNMS